MESISNRNKDTDLDCRVDETPQAFSYNDDLHAHSAIEVASAYSNLGWSVVPQKPAAKQPAVGWREFQDRQPASQELYDWFENQFPDAGLAVVLGPVSTLFAIDVDGKDAHDELVKRLGGVPDAPRVMSGSGDPHRFHLYFQHPEVETRARFTPWNPKLEFRGKGGITVLPPSIHKSGKPYLWVDGKSPWEIDLPAVPDLVLDELAAQQRRRIAPANATAWRELTKRDLQRLAFFTEFSEPTRLFLQGHHANSNDWNGRLFRAACDLAGNGIKREDGFDMLMKGAQPWDKQEVETATATINSAYSQPRQPARALAGARMN